MTAGPPHQRVVSVTKREGAEPFYAHHRRYDDWFVRHQAAYLSELLAVRALLPWQGIGLEIGVGTGRFAAPLGVAFGIDPAIPTLDYARERGVSVASGIGEALPFSDAQFGYVLLVTTICFVSNIEATLGEARRLLSPGGCLVVGFIDRESNLGREYLEQQAENIFYQNATFYSATEVDALLENTRFDERIWLQTLSKPLAQIKNIEPAKPGTGEGSFVVVRAHRDSVPESRDELASKAPNKIRGQRGYGQRSVESAGDLLRISTVSRPTNAASIALRLASTLNPELSVPQAPIPQCPPRPNPRLPRPCPRPPPVPEPFPPPTPPSVAPPRSTQR